MLLEKQWKFGPQILQKINSIFFYILVGFADQGQSGQGVVSCACPGQAMTSQNQLFCTSEKVFLLTSCEITAPCNELKGWHVAYFKNHLSITMPPCFLGWFNVLLYLDQTGVFRENKEQAPVKSIYGKYVFFALRNMISLCISFKKKVKWNVRKLIAQQEE